MNLTTDRLNAVVLSFSVLQKKLVRLLMYFLTVTHTLYIVLMFLVQILRITCSNALLFDPVTCFDRQNVKLNCSHLSSSNPECLKQIEPCMCIKYTYCFQNTLIQKLDIQSANTNVCNDNTTLNVNVESDCSKMVGPADFDTSFDTDSGTSVDTHTFTESLTSDSPNESFFRKLL